MFKNIQLSYPTYFLIFCVIAALLYAVSLYWKSSHFKDSKARLPFGLGLLRFFSVGLIAFLLLMPFLKHLIESQQEPIILIAEDRSQSITATMDESSVNAYKSDMDALVQSLSDKYEVKRFNFGQEVRAGVMDSFNDQSTNISSQIEYFENQFADQNIGAIVLATDGIFNEGSSPAYVNSKFKSPIHTVALGDTTIKRDLLIKNILNNRVAYFGDVFSMQVDVQAFNAAGSGSKITVSKIAGGQESQLKSENFNIGTNNFFKTFEFKLNASDVGNVKYRIRLAGITDELSRSNNVRDTYVEILDARQKILILANAPHPDLATLKKVIERNKNYEVEIRMASKPTPNLVQYDIVMLHNLPSKTNNIDPIVSTLKSKKISTIFMVGNQVNLGEFNKDQEALKISGNVSSMNQVQAIWKSGFNAYKIDEQLKASLTKYPPLDALFGEYTPGAKAEILLNQKIGKVETNYPLLCYSETNNWKTTVFAAEGIWKWRLYEYQQYQNDDKLFELVNKMIQYSSKKDDKRKFRSFVSKNVFKENEDVLFDAQLYNSNYELDNSADVFLTLKDNQGNSYDYNFSKTNNYYSLNAGVLAEGTYNYTAKTNYNGVELKSAGSFAVQSIQKEQYDLTARHSMLNSLSEKYGGKLYYPNEISTLGTDILGAESIKPVIYQRNKTESLLNNKWLFVLAGFGLLLEWFLRRFYGSY